MYSLPTIYGPEQGNIVGREYMHFVKNAGNPSFLMPFYDCLDFS
jgi:hypothetical protein